VKAAGRRAIEANLAMFYFGVIVLVSVLWVFATYINRRRNKAIGPIDRAHFEASAPVESAPNMPVRMAAQWLAERSHWGEGQNSGANNELAGDQLVERLTAGELDAWGRENPNSPLVRLQPAAFATGLLSLPEDSLFIVDQDATYYDLQVNEDEVKRMWPAKAP
jgi:hypothetical protein